MTEKETKEAAGVKKVGQQQQFDDGDIPQAAVFAKNLRVSLSNLQLYPPESQFIKDSISLAYGNLSPLLSKYGSLTLGEAEGKLLANAKPLSSVKTDDPVSAGLLTAFAVCNLRSVVFRAGLGLGGLTGFIQGLGRKKPFPEGSEWEHIEIENKVYIGASEEDLLVEGGMKYADSIQAKLAELCKGIESVTAAIAKADEAARARDREKAALAKTMSGMEPEALLELLMKDLPAEQEKVKYEALRTLPPEKVKQIVGLMSARHKEAEKSATRPAPGQAPAAKPAAGGFNKLFDLVKNTSMSAEVYQDLASKGLAQELPSRWTAEVSRPEDMAERQAGLLLEKEDASLLEARAEAEFVALLNKLNLFGKHGLVKALVEKLSKNLFSATGHARVRTAEALSRLMPMLEALPGGAAVQAVEDSLLAACEKEKDGSAYLVQTGLLARAAVRLWRTGDFVRSSNIIVMLRRHADLPDPGFPQKQEHALNALEGVAKSEMMQILMSDFSSPDPRKVEYSVSVAGRIGRPACAALIAAIKKHDDLRLRKIIAGALKETGPESLMCLVKALEEAKTLETAMKIVSVLDGIGGEDKVSEELKKMLASPDPRVRRFSLLAVSKLGYSWNSGAFMEAARDRDPLIRREAIRLLGEKKFSGAVETLLGFISPAGVFSKKAGEDEDIQTEACFALGKIGDEKALQPLIDAALPAGFLSMRRTRPASVRKAAILALRFFRAEKTTGAFKKLSADKDPIISQFAQSTLSNL